MTAFDSWRANAAASDILQAAQERGAKLRRIGREWIGPCPACGGADRFSINPGKRIFNCRGAVGGDVIEMVRHIDGCSFTEACERLTGEPPPNGHSRPLSEAEQAARNRARIEAERASEARRAEEARYQEETTAAAQRIWNESGDLPGTVSERYLNNRGIPSLDPWPYVLRHHPSLPYPGKQKRYPALICRVDDISGNLCAVWRIYLREDGRKADVPAAKLGLGPAGGGAVRFGSVAPKIAVAEGIESALGYWLLTGQKYPTWAALSTSGLVAVEIPLGVDHVVIALDGDRPLKKQGDEYAPAIPAGRKAALALAKRLITEGIGYTLTPEPGIGKDYLDIWNASLKEIA